MKNILLLNLVLLISVYATAQQENSKKELRQQRNSEEFAALREMIDSGKYEFQAQKFLSRKGRSIDLTTHTAYLRVDSVNTEAVLPYFGQAYNVGYSSDAGGINFRGEIIDLKQSVNERKQSITLTFSVKESTDTFDCTLTVFRSGSATLTITSQKRDPANYNGLLIDKN